MTSQYYINPQRYTLDKFQQSLEGRDVVPSRQLLKKDIQSSFDILRKLGITNLAELLKTLSTSPKISSFAKTSGLSIEYLTLLRREANSYFPAPIKLSRFSAVDDDLLRRLDAVGIKTSRDIFEMAREEKRQSFCDRFDINSADLLDLISLSDLSRLYGVGPTFARILLDAGMGSVRTLLDYTGDQIRKMYENKTGRIADFTARDIDFTLEIARELYE